MLRPNEQQGDEALGQRRWKLPNARLIDPLWHGDQCTGLSGLYSVVNGIRLVLAHKCQFSDRELHELFAAGLRFMDGRMTPRRAVTCGLRVNAWRRLAEALTDRTRERHEVLLFADRLFVSERSRSAAWAAIEHGIEAHRAVLMLMRGGRYTVVSGYTPSSLLLFDSDGAWWISKQVTGVPGDCVGVRHLVYPSSFLTIRA